VEISEELTQKHKALLYPTVRVRTGSAGGSGTIIYSNLKPGSEDEYETYVLTNEHVVDNNIKVEKQWNNLLQCDLKKDVLTECDVEVFSFEYQSWESGYGAHKADIVCYDKNMDLALLKVKAIKPFSHVARLFPKGEHKKRLRMFQNLYAVGCGMGHPPLATQGNLTGFSDIIDNYPYWLSSAATIYGNSGGAVFLADTYEFIGIPSRIAVNIGGFSADAITHLSYFIPIISVYKFFDDQVFTFIYDPSYTSEQCAEMRKKRREQRERMMAVEMSKEEVEKE